MCVFYWPPIIGFRLLSLWPPGKHRKQWKTCFCCARPVDWRQGARHRSFGTQRWSNVRWKLAGKHEAPWQNIFPPYGRVSRFWRRCSSLSSFFLLSFLPSSFRQLFFTVSTNGPGPHSKRQPKRSNPVPEVHGELHSSLWARPEPEAYRELRRSLYMHGPRQVRLGTHGPPEHGRKNARMLARKNARARKREGESVRIAARQDARKNEVPDRMPDQMPDRMLK